MNLEDLIAALTGQQNPQGPVRREREPMPQAPARYTGQRGALRPDPIPRWVSDPNGLGEPLAARARERAREREIARAQAPAEYAAPPFPGAPPEPPPPWAGPAAPRVSLSSMQGRYPADGTAADWILGPAPPRPRGPMFVSDAPRDPEPWRSPITTDRISQGDPARRGGFAPASALGTNRAEGNPPAEPAEMREDDLDAQFRAALERAQGRARVDPFQVKLAGVRHQIDRPPPPRR